MSGEIEGTRTGRAGRRRQGATDPLGREIMSDILITSAGTGVAFLAVLLAAQSLFLN